MKLMLAMYRFLYAITLDRVWVIRYVKLMDKKILEDIQRWRNENGNES